MEKDGASASMHTRSGNRWRPLLALAVLAAAVVAVLVLQSPRTIPGQAPLSDVGSIDPLREQFNADAGEARLILLASPT